MNIKKLLSGGGGGGHHHHTDAAIIETRNQGTSTPPNGSSPEERLIHFHERLAEHEKSMIELRNEVAKLRLTKQSLEAEKEELFRKLETKDIQMNELRRQLGGKDKLIYQQKSQFDEAVKNLSVANKAKACLTARLVDQDKKIALLEQVNPKPLMREELHVVREALHSLRMGFKSNDPQHHTIDTVEQSVALLMERLHMAEVQKLSKDSGNKQLNFDSTGDPKRSPITAYSSHLQRFDVSDNNCTKVLYFTERAVTPFMSSIPKRLGEIRLRDFKLMFDRSGNYRYHFKTVDPEYGVVKEEIINEDDILPGWDGKIIAWVEEDVE